MDDYVIENDRNLLFAGNVVIGKELDARITQVYTCIALPKCK